MSLADAEDEPAFSYGSCVAETGSVNDFSGIFVDEEKCSMTSLVLFLAIKTTSIIRKEHVNNRTASMYISPSTP